MKADRPPFNVPHERPCKWAEDCDGNWDTQCGSAIVMIEGTPFENEYAFCPFCGRIITQQRYEEGGDEG